jgi:hypothetical protein
MPPDKPYRSPIRRRWMSEPDNQTSGASGHNRLAARATNPGKVIYLQAGT